MLAFFVGFYVLPRLISQHNHRSLLEAGLTVTAVNLTLPLGNWWPASAVERYGKRLLIGVSATGLALSFLSACLVLIGMPLPVAYVAWGIGGAAMGIANPSRTEPQPAGLRRSNRPGLTRRPEVPQRCRLTILSRLAAACCCPSFTWSFRAAAISEARSSCRDQSSGRSGRWWPRSRKRAGSLRCRTGRSRGSFCSGPRG
jgi:hypothetical protein